MAATAAAFRMNKKGVLLAICRLPSAKLLPAMVWLNSSKTASPVSRQDFSFPTVDQPGHFQTDL
jgi:hypothetical protein